MAEQSKIQWTDNTFNPWRGCTKVSPGCAHCYAERGAARSPAVLGIWGDAGTRVMASDAMWREPLKWQRRAEQTGSRERVFCASLADVFEAWDGGLQTSQGVAIWKRHDGSWTTSDHYTDTVRLTLSDARARLWDLIRRTPMLTWQVLTKRPENIARMLPAGDYPNLWLGVTVENEDYRWRVDALAEARQQVRCPVGFVSAEPLLGPLTLGAKLASIDWLIVGGESGGGARPFLLDWVRSLIAQCRAARVACFVKQLGRSPADTDAAGTRIPLRLRSDPAHGGDWFEWPSDLCVRQFPRLADLPPEAATA